MLSSPRFDTYRNRPAASTTISAAVFVPAKSFGRVETVWVRTNVPGPQSAAKAATVDDSSLTT